MINFNDGQQTATLKLSLEGVSLSSNIDLRILANDPVLKDSRIRELTPKQLKSLLEYVDHRFKVDPRSALPWRDQFLRSLAKECEAFLKLPVKLTPERMAEIRKAVKDVNVSLERAIGAKSGEFGDALQYQYHDGFRHLTRDDDFIAVRRGGQIVSIIMLRGNDENDIINFLKYAKGKILNPDNIDAFRESLFNARKMKALELTNRKASKGVSKNKGKAD